MATSGVGRADTVRWWHESAASEKLNDERGVEPLRVSAVRDGAEPVNCMRDG
jgi:hypothetical protein